MRTPPHSRGRWILSLCLATFGCTPSIPIPPGDCTLQTEAPAGADPQALVPQAQREALVLFRAAGNAASNFVVSPLALQASLGAVYSAATDTTATQLADALGWTSAPADFAPLHSALSQSLAARAGSTLSCASRVWVDKKTPVAPAFSGTAQADFGAPLGSLDFAGDASLAMQSINAWVAKETGNRVGGVLQSKDTRGIDGALLTSLLQVVAPWRDVMVQTSDAAPFVAADGNRLVNMIYSTVAGSMPTVVTADYRAVDVPFAGEQLAMLFIVPTAPLATYAASLDANSLQAVFAALQPGTVSLAMPALLTSTVVDVRALLQSLGVTALFGSEAALPGLFPAAGRGVNGVVAQASIATTTVGLGALAKNGAAAPAGTKPLKPTFSVDHPFVFVVHDVRDNVPLLMGHIVSVQ